MRYRLGSVDDEEFEDEEDSAVNCNSDQDLCHPLCQCEKCSKWQKVGMIGTFRLVCLAAETQ